MGKNKILDIDYLKNNNIRMYYFGLGFIQVVLNQEERVHFYSQIFNTNPAIEGLHNHRYNFTSKILKGTFQESRAKLIIGDNYLLKNVSCGKDKELLYNPSVDVSIEYYKMPNNSLTMEYYEGDEYNVFYNEFHEVSFRGNTITHLKRSDIITDFAQVVYPKDNELKCPFAIKYSDDDLWEIINDVIKK